MALWVIGEGWGPFLMRHWTHFPDRPGNDDVNLPPPSVAATARRGPPMHDQGHVYRTWDIQGLTAAPTDRQLILDKREALDITHGDPNAITPNAPGTVLSPAIPGPGVVAKPIVEQISDLDKRVAALENK